jgi:hypothetical protein
LLEGTTNFLLRDLKLASQPLRRAFWHRGAQLVHAAKDLSKQFDAIENAIDTIDDAETRTRLKQSTKLSRETLSKAMLKLSQQIRKVVNCLGA